LAGDVPEHVRGVEGAMIGVGHPAPGLGGGREVSKSKSKSKSKIKIKIKIKIMIGTKRGTRIRTMTMTMTMTRNKRSRSHAGSRSTRSVARSGLFPVVALLPWSEALPCRPIVSRDSVTYDGHIGDEKLTTCASQARHEVVITCTSYTAPSNDRLVYWNVNSQMRRAQIKM
jgi:hypothetical protein